MRRFCCCGHSSGMFIFYYKKTGRSTGICTVLCGESDGGLSDDPGGTAFRRTGTGDECTAIAVSVQRFGAYVEGIGPGNPAGMCQRVCGI